MYNLSPSYLGTQGTKMIIAYSSQFLFQGGHQIHHHCVFYFMLASLIFVTKTKIMREKYLQYVHYLMTHPMCSFVMIGKISKTFSKGLRQDEVNRFLEFVIQNQKLSEENPIYLHDRFVQICFRLKELVDFYLINEYHFYA